MSGIGRIEIVEVGTQGPQGIGIPDGGDENQILSKDSDADYDFSWKDYSPIDGVQLTISDTEPSSPSAGDIWIDTSV